MKTHIVFDLDDTMTSSYDFNQQMFVDTFTAHVKDIDIDYLRKLHYASRGTSMISQFEEVINKFSLNLKASDLVFENEELHKAQSQDIKLFEGIEEILKKFKDNGKAISICTNRQYGSTLKILDKNNLKQYFDNIISCSDEKHEKPDPHCLLNLVRNYNVPIDNFLYFGDSKTDAQFAINAGMDFIIIDHYLNKKQFYQMILKVFALNGE